MMAWIWRYEDAEEKPVEGPNEAFASQSDAESWLGQNWRDLAAAGVANAVLLEDGRTEYRMGLVPAARE